MPNCIRCKVKYEDGDPDDYYCPECLIIHKREAEEVQKKIDARPKKVRPTKSGIQIYNELPKVRGFVNIKDL
jgi:uncharacterized Zn ribbon protein